MRALCFSRTVDLYKESGTYYGGNISLFSAFLMQRYDARWGLFIIILGFLFQIVGNIEVIICRSTEFYSGLVILMVLIAQYQIWRGGRIGRMKKSGIEYLSQNEKV